ncbi:MAG: hypothetical protein AAF368_04470, partial [Planctomycetota bacterium]
MAIKTAKQSMKYHSAGGTFEFALRSLPERAASAPGRSAVRGRMKATRVSEAAAGIAQTLHHQSSRLAARFHDIQDSRLMVGTQPSDPGTFLVPTESMIVEGARDSELSWVNSKYGFEPVYGGRSDKLLLLAPEAGRTGVELVFEAANALFERGRCRAAHPNFLRLVQRPAPSRSKAELSWNLSNDGDPGMVGA